MPGKLSRTCLPHLSYRQANGVVVFRHLNVTLSQSSLHSFVGANWRVERTVGLIAVLSSPRHVKRRLHTIELVFEQAVEFSSVRKHLLLNLSWSKSMDADSALASRRNPTEFRPYLQVARLYCSNGLRVFVRQPILARR